MGDKIGKRICEKLNKLKSDRQNEDTTWAEIAEWVRPGQRDIFARKNNSNTKGEERHQRVYDSTAEHANELLASALHSLLSSPTQHFFEYTSGRAETDKIPRVRSYLQKVEEIAHEVLNNSNFQSEVHSLYLDLPSFGTSVLWMEEDEEELIRFSARPIFTHWIEENEKGVVKTVATVMEMSVENAFRKYGMAAFGEDAKKLKNDLKKKIEIVVYLTDRKTLEQNALDGRGNPFTSYHVYKKGETVLKTFGYKEYPAAVPRWFKNAGETYGRSPAMKALPEIRYLNQVKRTTIRAAQKATDPPLAIQDDGVLGRVNLKPGGLTSVRASGRDNRVIEPILSGARPDIGMDVMNASRAEIQRVFYADQLQIPQIDRQSATEASIRDEDRTRLLGPLIGRMNPEFLALLVARLTGILDRKGMLPEAPEELQGVTPQVFFKSEIAKAQRMIEAQNLMQWLTAVGEMSTIFPNAAHNVNEDGAVRILARQYGVDMGAVNEEDQVQQIRQAQQQQQQQAEEAERGVQETQAAKNVAEAQKAATASGTGG